jgi:hypothetical protein
MHTVKYLIGMFLLASPWAVVHAQAQCLVEQRACNETCRGNQTCIYRCLEEAKRCNDRAWDAKAREEERAERARSSLAGPSTGPSPCCCVYQPSTQVMDLNLRIVRKPVGSPRAEMMDRDECDDIRIVQRQKSECIVVPRGRERECR